ncbi:MAG: LCCL domain-containing protein [Nostoc sp. DedQUE03]
MLPRVSHSQSNLALKEISWNTSASSLNLSGQIDRVFKVVCPRNGRIGKVTGTDTYSLDSSICTSAVHAGLITITDGGQVTIKIRPRANVYVATNRHDVNSGGGGVAGGDSFIFLNTDGSPVANLDLREISWNTSGFSLDLGGRLDQDFKFVCPRNGRIGTVVGTGTYSFGSSICTAAVHAGLITIRDGGQLSIRIRPRADVYVGTNRHDVNSVGGGVAGGDSFIFLNTDGSPVAVEPAPANIPIVNQTINKVKPKVCLPVVGCL